MDFNISVCFLSSRSASPFFVQMKFSTWRHMMQTFVAFVCEVPILKLWRLTKVEMEYLHCKLIYEYKSPLILTLFHKFEFVMTMVRVSLSLKGCIQRFCSSNGFQSMLNKLYSKSTWIFYFPLPLCWID